MAENKENKDYYFVGLAHTDLVIPASSSNDALVQARQYRNNNHSLFGYHPWAVPYLMEMDPADTVHYQSLAEFGLARTVKLTEFREHNPMPSPEPKPDVSLDAAKRKDALNDIASSLASLLEQKIELIVQEVAAEQPLSSLVPTDELVRA